MLGSVGGMGASHAVRRLRQGCRGSGDLKPLVVPRKLARGVNPFANLTLSRFSIAALSLDSLGREYSPRDEWPASVACAASQRT